MFIRHDPKHFAIYIIVYKKITTCHILTKLVNYHSIIYPFVEMPSTKLDTPSRQKEYP